MGQMCIRDRAGGCQDKDIGDLKEFLSEEHDIEEYPYLIYVEDDDDLLFNNPSFPVDDADASEPESPEAVPAFSTSDETPQTEAEPQAPKRPEIDTIGFNYRKTDTGNAERLVRRFGGRIRYVRDIGEWRVWDEKRWAPDTHGIIDRLAKKVAQEIFDEAKDLEDDERTSMLRWAITSEAKERRNAMIDLASKERTVVTVINDYDRDPWLFNCQNGTIDLHTGKLKPHDPADMITTISPVVYDPKAECPQWLAFLNEVMGSDQQMVDFLSRATGYTLSADTSAQAMFFPYGDGCNGKGVFLEVVRYVMGGYGKDTSFETFVITKNKNEARNDLAGLVGARFVTASESQDGHKLDEALIKRLTGGDPITCRKLHHEFFTFYPNFKIWMHSNYKPVIRGTDWGIWRRLKCIPFEVTIPDDKRDEQLASKLKTEAPGIDVYKRQNQARDWIRDAFVDFHRKFDGARPSGRWAEQFSIICWPIAHAILPQDLQRQLAQVLYEIRHTFTPELLQSPELLGSQIDAHSWDTRSRFRKLAEEHLLVGQIAAALLMTESVQNAALILPATLQRIATDLDRNRRSREWLKDAQRRASTVRLRGQNRKTVLSDVYKRQPHQHVSRFCGGGRWSRQI